MVHQKKKSSRENLQIEGARGKGAIKSVPKNNLKGDTRKGKSKSNSDWSNASQRDSTSVSISKESSTTTKGLSALQATFKKKLEGAKFRMINEVLYTSRGEKSFETFQKDPALFDIYHEGFREQEIGRAHV